MTAATADGVCSAIAIGFSVAVRVQRRGQSRGTMGLGGATPSDDCHDRGRSLFRFDRRLGD